MKVVIVGAGVLGLSAAFHLAREAIDVTVLDQRYPGFGSSSRSAGIYAVGSAIEPEVERRAAGVRMFHELEAAGRITLRKIGVLRLAYAKKNMNVLERTVELASEYGFTDLRVIDAPEIKQLLPDVDTAGVVGAVYAPSDGYLDGAELISVLAEDVERYGGHIVGHAKVVGLSRGKATAHEVLSSRGSFPADYIVNCAGPWVAKVGDALLAPVAIFNERHEAFLFEQPETMTRPIPVVLNDVPEPGAEVLYFRQEGETQMVAGLHTYSINAAEGQDPDEYFLGVSAESADVVVEKLAAAFPRIHGLRYRGGWAGLYPYSLDGDPIVGPHPDNPRVIVGAGMGGTGLAPSIALGSAIADWILYGEPRSIPRTRELAPTAARSGSRGAR